MQKRLLGLCIIVLTIVSPLISTAQESIELLPDSPIQGDIAERGETDTYTYTGSTGERITVTITAAEGSMLDTVLELYDANDEFLASNDDAEDSNDTTNSELTYVLPTDGQYRIVAMAFAGASVGEYEIILTTGGVSAESDPATSTPTEGGTLTYGQPATGTINATQSITYTFAGTTGEVINIAVDATPDTMLELQGPEANTIFADDDAGPGLNPYLRDLILPTDGDYTLTLTSLPNEAEGDFTLVVNTLEVLDTPIAYEETVEETLELNQVGRHTFEGSAGDVISALVTGSFDNYLELFAPDGSLIADDDDSAGGVQAGLTEVVLPETGTYALVVTGFSPPDVGDYSLSLALQGQVNITVANEPPSTIAYGDTVEGVLNPDNLASVTFTGAAGDIITIVVDAAFDGRLELFDPSNVSLTTDDDNGIGLNPLIQDYPLSSSGDYRIDLTGVGVTDATDFSLTLTNNPDAITTTGPSTTPVATTPDDENRLAYGDSVVAALTVGSTANYHFGATQDDVVSISVTAEDFDGFVELYGPDGSLLISDDDTGGNLNPLIQDFTIPQTGEYQIVYSSFGGQGSGDYTLTLTGTGQGATASTDGVAQTILSLDSSLRGSLTAGGASEYVFNGEANFIVSLSVAALDPFGSLDAYVEIYQPNGNLWLSDDDSGWQYNPALIGITLPESGTYRVVITSFAGVGAGDFVITLANGAFYLTPDGQTAQLIDLSSGSAVLTATLEGGATELYQFEAAQGQFLTVETASTDIGLYLYTPLNTGETQLESGTPTEIPETGTYLLLLYSPAGETVDVEVGVSGDAVATTPQTDATPVPSTNTTTSPIPDGATVIAGSTLQADTPVRGFINANEIQTWTFTPALTGEYSFVLNSDDRSGRYDPYLRILDANGAVLAEDDDSGGEFDAFIANLNLQANQPITIEVRGFAETSGGTFLLAVVTETTEAPPAIAGGVVIPGLYLDNALLLRGQQAEFNLIIQTDGVYNVAVNGLKLPYLDIYDAEGTLITRGAGIIPAQPLLAGNYRLVIYDRLGRTGSFRLSVAEATE